MKHENVVSSSELIKESFRSENENEDKYELCPRESWHFIFVLVFVLTLCFTLD